MFQNAGSSSELNLILIVESRISEIKLRTFAENWVGLGFSWSVSYIKPISAHEKLVAVGKKKRWPECHFWPDFSWVGLALG